MLFHPCNIFHFVFPIACLKMYVDKLTTFEQAEILDFPEVWFLGLNGKKIEGVPGAPTNNGKCQTSILSSLM